MPDRFRLTLTVTFDYTPDPADYPGRPSVGTMLAHDMDDLVDHATQWIDQRPSSISVKGEICPTLSTA